MNNFNTPSVIFVSTQAIWNPADECWDVVITQNECFRGNFEFSHRVDQVKVRDCDECVIADALLYANGIGVKALYNSKDDPIVL